MSDLKWGFHKNYGHRTLPAKWQSDGGYTMYQESPLDKKSHRKLGPVNLHEDFASTIGSTYTERSQTPSWAMSAYGVHTEVPWTDSLRSAVNPSHGGKIVKTEARKSSWGSFQRSALPSLGSTTGSRVRCPSAPGRSRSLGAALAHAVLEEAALSARGGPRPGTVPGGSRPFA